MGRPTDDIRSQTRYRNISSLSKQVSLFGIIGNLAIPIIGFIILSGFSVPIAMLGFVVGMAWAISRM